MDSKNITFEGIKYFDNLHLQAHYLDSANDFEDIQSIIFPISEFQKWADKGNLGIYVPENTNAELSENMIYNIQRFIYYKLNYHYISIFENAQKQINKLTVDVKRLSKENWSLKSEKARNQVPI
jgi:hypothetical protein